MDRRTALKQLAAGGAIAAGSLVVASNPVAAAGSNCVVAPASPFTVTQVSGRLRITPNANMVLPNVLETIYGWRILSYSNLKSNQNNRRLQIRRQSDSAIILDQPDQQHVWGGVSVPVDRLLEPAAVGRGRLGVEGAVELTVQRGRTSRTATGTACRCG